MVTDANYVFKVVTKDARKITGKITTSTIDDFSVYIFKLEDGTNIKYEHNELTNILKRENIIISTNIETFVVDESKIKIKTLNGEFSTTVYLRNNLH